MKKYTLQRMLMDMGIDLEIFKENILIKDGSTMVFKLLLAGCGTELEIRHLIEQYI